mgnify:CR=1 FL=1
MKTYQEMTLAERQAEYAALCRTHQEQKALGLDLNMARGKPGREQLDMVMEMYNIPLTADDFITDGIDARNYGYVAGIPIARRLFADLLGCKPGQVIAGGNSSLEMMFDAVSKAYTHGLLHSEKPWGKLDRVKWICPVPGYDRHFKVTESFGMELLSVPMTETGPDMDRVEQLIRDPEVRHEARRAGLYAHVGQCLLRPRAGGGFRALPGYSVPVRGVRQWRHGV